MKSINTINLSILSKKKSFDTKPYGRPILFFGVASLCLFFVGYVVTFAILTYYSTRLSHYNQEMLVLNQRVEQKRDVEAVLLTQKDKLARIDQIISTEPPYTQILTDIQAMLTPGVTLQSIEFAPDADITTDLFASNSADLALFVNTLEARDIEKYPFVTFTTSAITRTEEGGYSLALQFMRKKDGTIE